ncbi:MAG: DUF4537 domain-containing protein [Burkholderiales bacterium]|nr:DUF4537 domain-containing protein [Burkholderiales bacterium]
MKKVRMLSLLVLALAAGPALAEFQVGDRVECNWKNGGRYYSGKVGAKDGGKLFIQYDDGDKEHTTHGKCRHLNVPTGPMEKGSRVICNWKGGGTWYPGVIAEKTGDAVFIHYNDGDKEHTKLSMCKPR